MIAEAVFLNAHPFIPPELPRDANVLELVHNITYYDHSLLIGFVITQYSGAISSTAREI